MIEVCVFIDLKLAVLLLLQSHLHRCRQVRWVGSHSGTTVEQESLSQQSSLLYAKLKLRWTLVVQYFHTLLTIKDSLAHHLVWVLLLKQTYIFCLDVLVRFFGLPELKNWLNLVFKSFVINDLNVWLQVIHRCCNTRSSCWKVIIALKCRKWYEMLNIV